LQCNNYEVIDLGVMVPAQKILDVARERNVEVRFLGPQPRERVLELFRAADGTILSSSWENFPHTVVEALAVGTPVLAMEAGGVSEVVHDGVNGLLVEAHDEAAIGHAIERLRQSPVLLAGLRAEAAKTAHLYDMAFHTAHVTQAYRRLIAANRVHPFSRKAA
jgi:D-inositol-3-phosphate glycosyltransferase